MPDSVWLLPVPFSLCPFSNMGRQCCGPSVPPECLLSASPFLLPSMSVWGRATFLPTPLEDTGTRHLRIADPLDPVRRALSPGLAAF